MGGDGGAAAADSDGSATLLRVHRSVNVLRSLADRGPAWRALQAQKRLQDAPRGVEEADVVAACLAKAEAGARLPRPATKAAAAAEAVALARAVAPEEASLARVLARLGDGRQLCVVDAVRILQAARLAMMAEPSLRKMRGAVLVVGDLHGQLGDLLHILKTHGLPRHDLQYCFNGDYVDRGNNGCEVFLLVMLLRLTFPRWVHVNRGNHEDEALNLVYGFYDECVAKYGHFVYTLFRDVFCWLPLACVVNDRVFVVHGGLPGARGVTLGELRAIPRGDGPRCTRRQAEIATHCAWSDPNPTDLGCTPSPRGEGVLFGADVTRSFLKANGLGLVVRSHQYPGAPGYLTHHSKTVVTVFSASNYTLVKWPGLLEEGALRVDDVKPSAGAAAAAYNKGSVMRFFPEQKGTAFELHTYEPPMKPCDDPRRSVHNPHTRRPFQYSVPYGTLAAMIRGGVDPVERCVHHVRSACLRHAELLAWYWGLHEAEGGAAGVVSRDAWLQGVASVTNIEQLSVIAPSLETALRNRGFVNQDGSVRYRAFLQQAAYLVTPRPLPAWHAQLIRIALRRQGDAAVAALPATVGEAAMLGVLQAELPEVPGGVLAVVASGLRGGAGFKTEGLKEVARTPGDGDGGDWGRRERDRDEDSELVAWVRAEGLDAAEAAEVAQLRRLLREVRPAAADSLRFVNGCRALLRCTLSDERAAPLLSAAEAAKL